MMMLVIMVCLGIPWYEYWSVIVLLVIKYCVQIIYSKGIPYNEAKERFDIISIDFGLRFDITRIIGEYQDEFIMAQNIVIKDLFVCFDKSKKYEAVETADMDD